MNKNGQKSEQLTFKNGEQDGPQTEWYINGQKRLVANYKQGKHSDGVMTGWFENGKKHLEVTYKNGKELSREYWTLTQS